MSTAYTNLKSGITSGVPRSTAMVYPLLLLYNRLKSSCATG